MKNHLVLGRRLGVRTMNSNSGIWAGVDHLTGFKIKGGLERELGQVCVGWVDYYLDWICFWFI